MNVLWPVLGRNGQWGPEPSTSGLNKSVVIGQEMVTNDRLALLLIAAPDPKRTPPTDCINIS